MNPLSQPLAVFSIPRFCSFDARSIAFTLKKFAEIHPMIEDQYNQNIVMDTSAHASLPIQVAG